MIVLASKRAEAAWKSCLAMPTNTGETSSKMHCGD